MTSIKIKICCTEEQFLLIYWFPLNVSPSATKVRVIFIPELISLTALKLHRSIQTEKWCSILNGRLRGMKHSCKGTPYILFLNITTYLLIRKMGKEKWSVMDGNCSFSLATDIPFLIKPSRALLFWRLGLCSFYCHWHQESPQ